MRLEGRLDNYPLPAVLQTVMADGGSARILVADDDREGQLEIAAGCLIDAHWGDLIGEEAVFAVLGQRRGFFALSTRDDGSDVPGRLRWSWPRLLREAFSRAALAEPTAIPPLAADQQAALGQDLQLMLQNLEGDAARLADEADEPVTLLVGLGEMLNLVVSLSPEQARRHQFTLADTLPHHGWRGSSASFVRLDGPLIDTSGIAEIHAAAAFDIDSRTAETRSTMHLLVATLDEVSRRLCDLITDADSQQQLDQRRRSLIDDLAALIRSGRF
ncbi:MAG: DUF4388 domain-containing protein [Acidobacteriota bacterium]